MFEAIIVTSLLEQVVDHFVSHGSPTPYTPLSNVDRVRLPPQARRGPAIVVPKCKDHDPLHSVELARPSEAALHFRPPGSVDRRRIEGHRVDGLENIVAAHQ